MSVPRPLNVGILAIEVYIPRRFVAQSDLEASDSCAGKYTSGLGQEKLAFVDDRYAQNSYLFERYLQQHETPSDQRGHWISDALCTICAP